MCRSLEIMIECFCHSRVFEMMTFNERRNNNNKDDVNSSSSNNNNNMSSINNECACDKLEPKSFQFGICQLCFFKIIRLRRIVKSVLLSIQRKSINNIFYNNSARIFVQREIKFEFYSISFFFILEGVRLTLIDSWSELASSWLCLISEVCEIVSQAKLC